MRKIYDSVSLKERYKDYIIISNTDKYGYLDDNKLYIIDDVQRNIHNEIVILVDEVEIVTINNKYIK